MSRTAIIAGLAAIALSEPTDPAQEVGRTIHLWAKGDERIARTGAHGQMESDSLHKNQKLRPGETYAE